jgi:hypothetical protein
MIWRSYSSVVSTEPLEVPFDNLSSLEPVVGVAVSQGGLRTVQSTALVFSGFAISGTVTGIDLELSINRLARIQDKTIQLWVNGAAYAANLADLAAGNRHIYSWRNLDLSWQTDYGVLIDLQPHSQYPSSNLVTIRTVRLRTVA